MRDDGLYKSDRHAALPEDSVPMRLYRIAFPKPPKLAQDLVETQPAGPYWPACNGPCEGDREACPTPDACRICEPERRLALPRLFAEGKWANIAVGIALAGGAAAVAAMIYTGQWPKHLF